MIRFQFLTQPRTLRYLVSVNKARSGIASISRAINTIASADRQTAKDTSVTEPQVLHDFHGSTLDAVTKLHKLTPGPAKLIEIKHKLLFDAFNGVIQKAAEVKVDVSIPSEMQKVSEISLKYDEAYWQKIPLWEDVSTEKFIDYRWQTANTVQGEKRLVRFLNAVLPEQLSPDPNSEFRSIQTREDFIKDVLDGIALAPMAIRLTPHTLSVIDWSMPFDDPVRRQFLPMKASKMDDHPMLELDSLHEEGDSKVKGLVHRYPDKALFLATSACPVYCRFCTRSYAIGPETSTVSKHSLKPTKKRWDEMFAYIETTPALRDIVVSGGDSFYLTPDQLYEIGERLIKIEHIRRFRFASKGLAVCPTRFIDPADHWVDALIAVSNMGKAKGKAVALHTHFNHENEITWATKQAAQKLFKEGVTVRNQTVLLRGVNDNVETMSALIHALANNNILPYYVYQGDMVKGVEDLRTPLQTILDLEEQIRGSIAGFMMPSFVVDLPGGGGKRLAASYKSYDRETGVSTFVAPAVGKGIGTIFRYYDPVLVTAVKDAVASG